MLLPVYKVGDWLIYKTRVRPACIPLLVNYFQVKWKGRLSLKRELKGGGPQGSFFRIWEYLSQSNGNANCLDESVRFKFVDDLKFLEIINLLNVGVSGNKQFFLAQWNHPVARGEWTEQARLNLEEFEISVNLEWIKSKSNFTFKNLVKAENWPLS